MIIDSQARFDWDDAITATRVSQLSIDLQKAGVDLGQLEDLWMVGVVTEAFTAAGAATLQIDLVDDDNGPLASPATIEPILAATGKATLVAGYQLFKRRFSLEKITQRYLGLNYTVATGPFTAGKVRAFLTRGVDAQKYLPRGYVNY